MARTKPASQTSGVFAVGGNRGEEFAQHFFRRDEKRVGTVGGPCSVRPGITRNEEAHPINGIGKNLPQRLAVPYT